MQYRSVYAVLSVSLCDATIYSEASSKAYGGAEAVTMHDSDIHIPGIHLKRWSTIVHSAGST